MTAMRPDYVRRPESVRGVDAIHYTDAASGQRIAVWVKGVQGRGAALCENGSLIMPSEEFDGRAVWVPLGWVVYKEFLSNHFHTIPKDQFDQMYERRA